MTTKERSGNEVIAEFDGYKVRYQSDTSAHNTGISSWPLFTKDGKTTDTVFYDTSWDWIIPVVQKWANLYLTEEFLEDRLTDTYNMYIMLCERLDRAMIKNYDINAVYNQLLKNIEWYNNQKANS